MKARLLLLSLLVAVGATAVSSSACGPATTEPPVETPKKSRPMDRTEVTMERSAVDGSAADPAGSSVAAPASPATASPAPTATTSDPSDDPMIGGPQEAAVERAIAPVRPRLRACYKKALAAEPGIGGAATFDATIGKEGHVASARFVKRDGLNDDMVGCLLAAVKAMTFDASRKSQIVALSFGTPPPPAPTSALAADAGPPKK